MTVGSQTTAELIAEAKAIGNWDRHVSGPDGNGAEGPTLFARVVFALEAAEQEKAEAWRVAAEQARMERDRAEAAEQRAEEAERERDSAMKSYEDYMRIRRERDQLAVVIERAEDFVTRHYLDTQMGRAVLTELSTPLGDALREVKAATWDEGYADGRDDLTWDQDHRNPYRAQEAQS